MVTPTRIKHTTSFIIPMTPPHQLISIAFAVSLQPTAPPLPRKREDGRAAPPSSSPLLPRRPPSHIETLDAAPALEKLIPEEVPLWRPWMRPPPLGSQSASSSPRGGRSRSPSPRPSSWSVFTPCWRGYRSSMPEAMTIGRLVVMRPRWPPESCLHGSRMLRRRLDNSSSSLFFLPRWWLYFARFVLLCWKNLSFHYQGLILFDFDYSFIICLM